MDIKTQKRALDSLTGHKKIVWKALKKHLKNSKYPPQFSIPPKYMGLSEFHWEVSGEYPKRQGKYLRPTLLMLSCSAAGGDSRKAINTAVAMQLSEEWLLIHDDVMDGSVMRRGKPTLNRMYNMELAVNAGDVLQTVMWKVLFDNQEILGLQKSLEVSREFNTMISRTLLGQTVEAKWFSQDKFEFADEDWYFVCDSKSCYYSMAGPLRLGAMIAGANRKQLNLLIDFGLQLGRCFQLVDDILDITSDFDGLKKQKGNDIYEGKRTVILGHLLRIAKPRDKKRIVAILKKGRDDKSQDEVEWIVDKMNVYGSIDYAKKLAKSHKEKAELIFKKDLQFLSVQPHRDNLSSLIHFILERSH